MEPLPEDLIVEWTEEEHLLFYQFILENMTDAAYCLTPEGGFKYVNEAACKMLGYTKSEFSKLTVDNLLPPNHVRDWHTLWTKLKEAHSLNFESVHRHKTGKMVAVEVQTTWLSFKSKEFCYAIVNDISERKANEEKLKESERRLRLFLENNLDAFLLTTPDGSILFVNQAACNMFGRSAEEIYSIGRSGIIDVTDPRLAIALEERARTGIFKGELTGKRKDGTLFPMEVSSSYFYNDDGELRTSMVIRDITERKKAEEILKQSEARLAELNATKDKFFSIVSHDLRNPVHTMLGAIQILNEDIDSMDHQTIKKFTQNLQITVNRLYGLLDNLLNWSLLQMNKIKFSPESVSLNHMIHNSIDIVTDQALSKDITIKFAISEQIIVLADREMVASIMQNLLTNAIKFSFPKSIIVVSAKLKHTQVEVVIEDSGTGMEDDRLKNLFDIGANLNTTGTKGEKGTGLGLILSKEFVEKNGGTIRVESTVGVGSRFIFTLPLAPF